MRFAFIWATAISVGAGQPLVELGRHLFYDARLSGNGSQSCASCHKQELAFTDGRARAVGSTGETHPRSAMSLVNVGGAKSLTWTDASLTDLAGQARIPMFGEQPVELGWKGRESEILARIGADSVYRRLFGTAFPGSKAPVTVANVTAALAAFERSIVSRRSAYDRYYLGNDPGAISQAAQRGEALFFTENIAGCFRCHGGADFSDGPHRNTGVNPGQTATFKTPTLRNIAITAPYMHDGSLATLDDVLTHYSRGGHASPGKDARMTGFPLTPRNRADLIAFLESLTDQELLTDPRFVNPWLRANSAATGSPATPRPPARLPAQGTNRPNR